MTLNSYELSGGTNPLQFYFTSSGESGCYPLMISINPISGTNIQNLFNLGFGVISGETINDRFITNNGDTELILNTVGRAAEIVLEENSGITLFVSGSTEARTQLYGRKINRYISEISKKYSIYGYTGEAAEFFQTGKTYNGFFLQNKTN